jgi:drug/metabolite transporter (DMT)-like permease
MKQHMSGISWMIGFTMVDAVALNVSKVIGASMHVFQFLFIANAIAATILFLTALKANSLVKSKNPKMHVMRASVELFGQALMFSALMLIPISEVKSILFLVPIIASIIAVLFLHERSTWAKWGALIVSFVGMLVVLQPDKDIIHYASFFALGAALLLSIGLIIVKRTSDYDSPLTISLYFTSLFTLFSLPFAIYYWQPVEPDIYGWILLFGVLVAMAHITISSACANAPLTVLTPFFFVGLIFVATLAYFCSW